MDNVNVGAGGASPQGTESSVSGSGNVPLPVYVAGSDALPSDASTIQQSEAVAEMLGAGLMQANNPQLQSPDQLVGGLKEQIQAVESRVITIICNSMMKTADEMAQQSKESAKSQALKDDILKRDQQLNRIKAQEGSAPPQTASDYLASVMSQSVNSISDNGQGPNQTAFGIVFAQTMQNWLINPISAGAPNDSYPGSGFVTGCLMGSIGTIGGMMASSLSSSATGYAGVSVNPVADALNNLGPASGLPGDYQSAAALVAAMLYTGALNKSNAMMAQAAKGANTPPQDLQFAMNFAKETMAIVTKNIQGQDPTTSEANRFIKLMLSTIALNLLYRAKFGGMTGQELKGLLEGNNANIPDDVKEMIGTLVAQINLNLPTGNARSTMLAKLESYVNSKASVDSMLQTTSNLRNLMGFFPRQEALA